MRGARFLTAFANQSAIQLLRARAAGTVRHVLHSPSASMVAVLMLNPASFAAARDPVQNRILHQGLQNELRYKHFARLQVNIPGYLQSVLQPHLFEFEVSFHKLQLFRKRDEIGISVLE